MFKCHGCGATHAREELVVCSLLNTPLSHGSLQKMVGQVKLNPSYKSTICTNEDTLPRGCVRCSWRDT